MLALLVSLREEARQVLLDLVGGLLLVLCLPASPGSLRGALGMDRQERVPQSHSPSALAQPAKFFPLAVLLFSISFLWILGARVIGFEANAKLSFPQIFPKLPLGSSSLGGPESCLGSVGAAHTHTGLGKGGPLTPIPSGTVH